VADECVHSLHGSLCHFWVRHWAQDVHKEQLGGSGKHPACAQAEMTWCPDVHIACTLSLTSHACCSCPAAVAARLQRKCTSTKASHAERLSCALLMVGTCTASHTLSDCAVCNSQIIHLFRHHMPLSMNRTCYAAVVYHCRLQLNDAVKHSNDIEYELYHICVFKPGCLMSHNWLHIPVRY